MATMTLPPCSYCGSIRAARYKPKGWTSAVCENEVQCQRRCGAQPKARP